MTADVRAWLADLAARDPAAARQAGAAILALLDQGPDLGAPLVAPVAPWSGPVTRRREPDPRATLDDAYQELLGELTSGRRAQADVATLRKRVELQLSEPAVSAAPAKTAELRRTLAELAEAERKITASTQLLQAKVEAFRIQKESVKAAYTAAEASAAVNDVLTRFGDGKPGAPSVDADAMLADARARARHLLSLVRGSQPDAGDTADPPGPGEDGPAVPLLALRPAAPGCLATRILFLVTPPPDSAIVLLAAGTEHAGPGSGPDRLIALARARGAEMPPSGGYDGDGFVHEFFRGQEEELVGEVSALAAASQPRGLAGLRELAGLTREQLAGRLGVPPERVAATESTPPGASEVPTLTAYVEALGARLDVSADLGTERIPLG